MPKITTTASVLCSLLFLNNAFGVDTEIFFPGNVLSIDLPNEGKGLNGAPCLALYSIDGKFAVGKSVLSFGPSSDSDVIEIVSSRANTITLFRKVNMKPGDVQTAVFDLAVSEKAENMLLGSKAYSIRETKQGLTLNGSEGESIIIENRVGFYVYWARDLDRDGKLDLIVSSDDGDGKNSDSCLLLSSTAEKGRPVKVQACQFYSG